MFAELILLGYLGILSFFDLYYKNKDFGLIPNALVTFFPILALSLFGYNALFGMVIFSLFGYMLYEMEFYKGGQDLKIMIGLGCIPKSIEGIVILLALVLIVGFLYKLFIRLNTKKIKQIPFIPSILISYILYLLLTLFI